MSADWFWEQDADLRFTYISESNREFSGLVPSALLGKTRQESSPNGVSEEQWVEHDAILARREPLVDFLLVRVHEDGENRYLTIQGRPFHDAQGNFAGYRGVGRDDTDQMNMIQKLRENEAAIMQVLDASPIAVCMVSAGGEFEYANERFQNLFDGGPGELVGRRVESVYADPAQRAETLAVLERGDQVRDYEYQMVTCKGQRFPALLSVQAAPTRDGRVIGWAVDLSRRKAMEQSLIESQNRFQGFAEACSDFLWETDADHNYIFFSESFQTLAGLDPADLLGENRRSIIKNLASTYPFMLEHLKSLDAHLPFRDFRSIVPRKDGAIAWHSTNARPVFDENQNFAGYRGAGNDITSQVNLENALREASDNASAANQAKSEFLSSMSHELRTPLNGILGFGQLLEMDDEHPLSTDQKEGVRQILKSGNHLLELIDQVLDLSRIEQGHLSVTLEDIDPSDVLEDCLSLVRQQALSRGLSVERSGLNDQTLPILRADRVRLKQVLLNLLMNAVKYNTTGDRLGLDCQLVADEILRFKVWDNGPGIPPGKEDDIFKPFDRLGMEGQGIEGTGIGLTICRELVGLMGGEIGYQGQSGGGAAFWFELPVSQGISKPMVESSAKVRDYPSTDDCQRHKVLYIEDNPANLMLMEHIIGLLGDVELLSAHTAELGIVLINKENPDLVLMDINLPGMGGIEAIRAIRASRDTARIPVVAISAQAMPHDIERAVNAGFQDYLTKPLDIPVALQVINETLRRSPKPSG